ncbi:aliphatic sulfonates ABC transporter substrate-binding protein [Scytonema sp. HK-05]|uniref:sulfonate ABC transporter substrate-binding protein n=1 Tax=Scytonema sp. HK-05 TaxID=1137095 RepID=UPI0009359205|nr:sulfonate ABC transporter substrate-binding protein [Scytonema sp. HK-05]OKH55894.1 hypothetical protein NIES2130_26155 [Scytonema sp. HK-05]BAY49536.1 aliphatic sulfonates ABC transporter substrate-binding protein [Scytonema sp. HK-05]
MIASHAWLFGRSLPSFIAYLLLLAATLTGCAPKTESAQNTQTTQNTQNTKVEQASSNVKQTEVRIGYQKGTAFLNIVKARGSLEKRLQPSGVTVKWSEFAQGPPMMEAMNAGAVDIGVVGAPPPIFAQAAGTPVVYVASSLPNGKGQVILVKKDSPFRTVTDLKGKKVAVGKGTAGHYLIVKVLESAGLTLKDIQPVYLLPPEARAAFEGGNVDAWVTSDPRYAEAERTGKARLLANGEKVAEQRSYFIATRPFVDKHSDIVKVILDEQAKDEEWAKSNRKETAKILETATGVKAANWEWSFERRPNFGVLYMNDQIVNEQQQMADLFYKLKLIPKPVQIKEATWIPQS